MPQNGFNGAAVSRPRILRSAVDGPMTMSSLQWGRGLTTTDTESAVSLAGSVKRLQWGRGLTTTDTGIRWLRRPRGAQASMGPRSHDHGYSSTTRPKTPTENGFNGAAVSRPRILNATPAAVLSVTATLQWGRGLSRPRIRAGGSRKLRRGACFNGAAVSRPRILGRGLPEVCHRPASMGPRSHDHGYLPP